MIYQPKPGQQVQVWYEKKAAALMPLHGQLGRVVAASRGPGPRNAKIDAGGAQYIVPRGNLRWPP